MTDIDWSRYLSSTIGLSRLGTNTRSFATVRGSKFEMFSNTPEVLRAIARDVDAARKTLLMEFYIWNEGGVADEVLEAVIRAAQRGVVCRLLIDALGARPWWKGKQPQRLRDAGVEVRSALPVGLFRTLVGRTDLRVHRKIVVVDGQVAWTGSMNLVDPSCFKQNSGVGEWVDAMVRVQGTAVAPLGATMLVDWALETGESVEQLIESTELNRVGQVGSVNIQVIPLGPGQSGDGLLHEVVLFVYDDEFSRQLGQLQQSYIDNSDRLESAKWGSRSFNQRLLENTMRLVSPLL